MLENALVKLRHPIACEDRLDIAAGLLPLRELDLVALGSFVGDLAEKMPDLAEMPANITASMDIHPVRWIEEALGIALERALKPNQPHGEAGAPAAASKDKEATDHSVTH